MPYTLRIFEDPAAVAGAAVEEFIRRALQALEMGRSFSCALPGGFSPLLFFRALAGERAGLPACFWDRIHLFWGDERDVPPDHAESNFGTAQAGLLSQVPIPPENIHRIQPETGGAPAAAARYEGELRRFFGLDQDALPRFDLIFLGMGEDGHTASIFPGSDVIGERTRLVAAPYVERLHSYRVTLTPPVINNAACVIFLVTGATKANILARVLGHCAASDPLPAQLIAPVGGELIWLIDHAAAAALSVR